MLISKWKNKSMAVCMGLLILICLLALIHWGLKSIAIRIPPLQNSPIIRRFSPNSFNNLPQAQNVHINWPQLYPFDNSTKTPSERIHYFPKLHNHTPAERFEDWTKDNMYFYHSIAELQRFYDYKINWNVITPALGVVPLNDGYWAFVYKKQDMNEYIKSVVSFHEFLQSQNIPLTYIQAPGKINKYGVQDAWLRNRYDFSNTNADQLLSGLRKNGIDTIDLREYFHQTTPEEQYHQLFFRTDHHWLPQTALSAAGFIADYLHKKNGIEINSSNLDASHYSVEWLPNFFLGSIGKKVTLSRAKPDDFPILHPDFPTNIHLEIPDKGIKKKGPFEISYDETEINCVDYYNKDPHGSYGYGTRPFFAANNLQLNGFSNQKILIIRDSFGDTMIPLLSLGCKNITAVDLRYFTGSLRALVKEFQPDAVLILYTNNWQGSIHWNNHNDEFDFR